KLGPRQSTGRGHSHRVTAKLGCVFQGSGICSKAVWDKMRLNCQQLWKVQKDACSDVLEK
ncbi:hypothetical protein N9E48_08050, partial [Paracoccaceae bacterium]|nr:hypothetical protein [Paracoccaceae bacterium]